MSKLRKERHNGHFRICLNENNAKNEQRRLFKGAVAGAETGEQQFVFFSEFFLERDFSLVFRQIRPSAVFGTRRKAALRGAGYAWTPNLRSFDKLLEVGVSPYLGFTLYLSVFQCFG